MNLIFAGQEPEVDALILKDWFHCIWLRYGDRWVCVHEASGFVPPELQKPTQWADMAEWGPFVQIL